MDISEINRKLRTERRPKQEAVTMKSVMAGIIQLAADVHRVSARVVSMTKRK